MNDEKCTLCDGNGKLPCRGCGGSGKSKEMTGAIKSDSGWSSCATCNGTGEVTCPRCNGSGKKQHNS